MWFGVEHFKAIKKSFYRLLALFSSLNFGIFVGNLIVVLTLVLLGCLIKGQFFYAFVTITQTPFFFISFFISFLISFVIIFVTSFVLRLFVFCCYDFDLAVLFSRLCFNNTNLLKFLGFFIFWGICLGSIVSFQIFHLLVLVSLFVSFGVTGTCWSALYFKFGCVLIHPRAFIVYFFIILFNFMTLCFFGVSGTFIVLGSPIALLLGLPSELFDPYDNVSGEIPGGFLSVLSTNNTAVISTTAMNVAEKLMHLHHVEVSVLGKASVNYPSSIVLAKTLEGLGGGKKGEVVDVLRPLNLASNKSYLALKNNAGFYEKMVASKYPPVFAQLSKMEQSLFYKNSVDVMRIIELANKGGINSKELVRSVFIEAAIKDSERLLDGLLGKQYTPIALKALAASTANLGPNPLLGLFLCDKNHFIQSANPVATFTNDFSTDRIVIAANELLVALKYGLREGAVLKVDRPFLGDVLVTTPSSCTVLSVKLNGAGNEIAALTQVAKAVMNEKLSGLHAVESFQKEINTYIVCTAGCPFGASVLVSDEGQDLTELLVEKFLVEWNQKFDVDSLD